jgi:hypothetical protein
VKRVTGSLQHLKSRKAKWLLGIAVLLTMVGGGAAVVHAQAGFACTSTVLWNLPDCVNYAGDKPKWGQTSSFHNSFLSCATCWSTPFDLPGYINAVNNRLFSGDTMDEMSAAVMVDVMLGRPAARDGSKSNAINYAKNNFGAWKALVTSYSNAGLINWDYNYMPPTPYETSSYDSVEDDIYHYQEDGRPTWAIRFIIPAAQGGGDFAIEYFCGNLIGAGLPSLSSPPSGKINPPTNVPPDAPGTTPGAASSYSTCQQVTGTANDPTAAGFQVPVTVSYSISGGPSGKLPVVKASGSSPYAWIAPTNAAIQSSLSQVTFTAEGDDAGGKKFTIGSPITMGPCKTITGDCPQPTVSPAVPEPGTTFSVSASVDYSTTADAQKVASSPGFKFFVNIQGPNGLTSVFSNANMAINPSPPNSQFVTASTNLSVPQAGVYVVGWGVVGPYGATNCGSSVPPGPGVPPPPAFNVVYKPIFEVNGGDISAGASMTPAGGTTCSIAPPTPNGGSIVGWSANPGTSNFAGAGTQYAAFALNHLQEFTTAQGSAGSPTAAKEPAGLAFANSGLTGSDLSPTSGLYGGKVVGPNCVHDYFANAQPANTFSSTTMTALLAGVPGYVAGGNIPNASKTTVYINGNLTIDSDVKFSGLYPGGVTDIPVFSVVVKGNIYIDPSVKRLDGIYVAQPSAATPGAGVIYTCVPSGYSGVAVSLLNKDNFNDCSQQLVVNGSFIARQVWMLRSSGTASSGIASEVFNYTPELWLTAPGDNNLSKTDTAYNAVSDLPPAL